MKKVLLSMFNENVNKMRKKILELSVFTLIKIAKYGNFAKSFSIFSQKHPYIQKCLELFFYCLHSLQHKTEKYCMESLFTEVFRKL